MCAQKKPRDLSTKLPYRLRRTACNPASWQIAEISAAEIFSGRLTKSCKVWQGRYTEEGAHMRMHDDNERVPGSRGWESVHGESVHPSQRQQPPTREEGQHN